MINLQLDLDYNDERSALDFCRWLSRHHVLMIGFIDDGPGGGNPCISVVGMRHDLINLVVDDFYCGDPDDHRELLP